MPRKFHIIPGQLCGATRSSAARSELVLLGIASLHVNLGTPKVGLRPIKGNLGGNYSRNENKGTRNDYSTVSPSLIFYHLLAQGELSPMRSTITQPIMGTWVVGKSTIIEIV